MVAISTTNLVPGLVEMLIRLLMISWTLGDELERNSTTVVAKLKAELDESSNSLKANRFIWHNMQPAHVKCRPGRASPHNLHILKIYKFLSTPHNFFLHPYNLKIYKSIHSKFYNLEYKFLFWIVKFGILYNSEHKFCLLDSVTRKVSKFHIFQN